MATRVGRVLSRLLFSMEVYSCCFKALEEMMVLYSDAESLTSVSEALDIVGSVFLGHGLLLGL